MAEAERVRQQWGQRGWGVMTVGLSAALSLAAAVLVSLFSYLLNIKK